jgi:hypothetical protein
MKKMTLSKDLTSLSKSQRKALLNWTSSIKILTSFQVGIHPTQKKRLKWKMQRVLKFNWKKEANRKQAVAHQVKMVV